MRICYSHCMVGKVVLGKSADHFGNEICVMAVNIHNKLANNIWSDKLTEYWTWCHKLSSSNYGLYVKATYTQRECTMT